MISWAIRVVARRTSSADSTCLVFMLILLPCEPHGTHFTSEREPTRRERQITRTKLARPPALPTAHYGFLPVLATIPVYVVPFWQTAAGSAIGYPVFLALAGVVNDSLLELWKGRAAIVIAHRLATLDDMDRIVVIEEGRIAEQGTREEPLDAAGRFADTWGLQRAGLS